MIKNDILSMRKQEVEQAWLNHKHLMMNFMIKNPLFQTSRDKLIFPAIIDCFESAAITGLKYNYSVQGNFFRFHQSEGTIVENPKVTEKVGLFLGVSAAVTVPHSFSRITDKCLFITFYSSNTLELQLAYWMNNDVVWSENYETDYDWKEILLKNLTRNYLLKMGL